MRSIVRERFLFLAAALSVTITSVVSPQGVPLDTASLGTGPHSTMHTLLEKTIFRVDVLTLDLRFGTDATARLGQLVHGRELTPALADSVAAVALRATDVWARLEFLRNVRLDQFLDGIRDNLRAARESGIVTPAEYDEISEGLPDWYAFLAERGIRDGDQMFYRIRGDTLQTAYRSADGKVLLDQTDVGAHRRLSVLGGYFAPKSEFRRGLIESLFSTNRESRVETRARRTAALKRNPG